MEHEFIYPTIVDEMSTLALSQNRIVRDWLDNPLRNFCSNRNAKTRDELISFMNSLDASQTAYAITEVVIRFIARFSPEDCLSELLSRGAHVDTQDQEGADSALGSCAVHKSGECIGPMMKLIRAGADVNHLNSHGPIIIRASAQAAIVLVKHGANLHTIDNDGLTVLHKVIKKGGNDLFARVVILCGLGGVSPFAPESSTSYQSWIDHLAHEQDDRYLAMRRAMESREKNESGGFLTLTLTQDHQMEKAELRSVRDFLLNFPNGTIDWSEVKWDDIAAFPRPLTRQEFIRFLPSQRPLAKQTACHLDIPPQAAIEAVDCEALQHLTLSDEHDANKDVASEAPKPDPVSDENIIVLHSPSAIRDYFISQIEVVEKSDEPVIVGPIRVMRWSGMTNKRNPETGCMEYVWHSADDGEIISGINFAIGYAGFLVLPMHIHSYEDAVVVHAGLTKMPIAADIDRMEDVE